MNRPTTITKQLIGWDNTINNEPVYLTIFWDDEEWMLHTDRNSGWGFASGGGTDTEASEYIKFNLIGSGWFKQAENLDD